MKKINEIDFGYQTLDQYYDKNWKCEVDGHKVSLSLVSETIDMYEATGEGQEKGYNIMPSIGVINLNVHRSLSEDVNDDHDGDYSYLEDVLNYCGFVDLSEVFLNIDKDNDNLMNKLTIKEATFDNYQCRFTGETKIYPKFKDQGAARQFSYTLIERYGNVVMGLIGFYLDKPVNLIGETGWKTIELCHFGIK